MPPKKKLDPAQQEAAFEEWRQSEEYKHMSDIRELLKKKPKEGRLSSTEQDLTGDWQDVLDMVFDLYKFMKVKTAKVKGIEQSTIRSILFAKEDKEDEKVRVDGVECGVVKAFADKCDKLRHFFITYFLEVVRTQVPEWTSENYLANRKTMSKSMSDFMSYYKMHTNKAVNDKDGKGGHNVIFETMNNVVLRPLRELIEINAKYRKFQSDNIDSIDREIQDFKLNAIQDLYILYLEDVLRILYTHTPPPPYTGLTNNDQDLRLRCTPSIKKLFYKINLKNWKNSPCDKHYINPLRKNFRKLQNTLYILWFNKVNHWKLPLWRNVEVVQDLKQLINSEMIADRLLGTPLRRDQLNFVYKTVSVIHDSNEMIQGFLLQKDLNIVENCIPKLVVFHQIQHIRRWKDRKAKDKETSFILEQNMSVIFEQRKKEEMKSPLKQAGLNISMMPVLPSQPMDDLKSTKKDLKKTDIVEEEKSQEQIEFEKDEEKYGRYWILDTLIDDKHKQIVEECVELLRHINLAVQQDIQDKIIQEGLEPRFKDRRDKANYEKAKEAQKKTEQIKRLQNSQVEINDVRPPNLWNYPKVLEGEHQFRAIAEPKNSYIDKRFENFDQKAEQIKQHLVNHQKYMWDYMVDKVIDVFKNEYEEDPGDKLPNSEFHVNHVQQFFYNQNKDEKKK